MISLNLTIENETRLPDGGSLTYVLKGERGADIGRDPHLDWTLPDSSRCISGKHCEIRYRDGGYWLSDVSTNGTFLNGDDQRLQSPYLLRDGDRLAIGHYIVAVGIDGDRPIAAPEMAREPPQDFEDLWRGADDAAPPVNPREFRPATQGAPVRPDFLEWAVDLPNSPGSGFVARPVAPASSDQAPELSSWDAGAMQAPPAPEPAPPVPAPRRSVWVSQAPAGHWIGEDQPVAPPPSELPVDSVPTMAPRPVDGSSDFVARFAKGAGLAPATLASQPATDLAERLGRLMLLVTDNVKQLLSARSQTKRIARSSSQTMIAALDNNPLKFSPTAADALNVMLGPPSGGYLDAERALQQSFDDLKSHQVKTFASMQKALLMLLEDIAPAAIERDVGAAGGPFGLRRAKLWSLYEKRWLAKTRGGADDMQVLFMQLFADAYDQASSPKDPGDRSGR